LCERITWCAWRKRREWAPVWVKGVQRNCITILIFFNIFVVKNVVVKHAVNGLQTVNVDRKYVNTLVWYSWDYKNDNLFKPYFLKYMDKKMKIRILGLNVTVWRLYLNILLLNSMNTCVVISQTSNKLMMKNYFTHLKSIIVCTYFVFFSYCWNYVILSAMQGTWTRSSVKIWNKSRLKVCQKFKGVDLFVCNTSTICLQEFIERVAQNLLKLKSFSVKCNISSVNEIVKLLLKMPEFWLFCYNSVNYGLNILSLKKISFIRKKKILLNGITLEYFQNLSLCIIWGNFNFGFTCNFSKLQRNIKLLRIAGLRNKIVQKGMSVILEQVSEHQFLHCSFGFRRARFSHDALIYISQKVSSRFWAIKGNISFIQLNHKRLVNLIIKNYASQQIFIDLIYKMLKTELIFINSLFMRHKKKDKPQSSTVNFILYNIYLHELDVFIVKNNVFTQFWKKKPIHLSNKNRIKFTKEERFQGDTLKKTKSKKKMWEYYDKLRTFKLKPFAEKKFQCFHQKIIYVRYAADFLLFGCETKKDSMRIKLFLINFFTNILALEFCSKKIKIVYLKKDKVEFVGFQVWQFAFYTLYNKKTVISIKKGKRAILFKLRIVFSKNKLLYNLLKKGLLILKKGRLLPTSYKPALRYDIVNIIRYFKITFYRICHYYSFAHNSADIRLIYNYFGRFIAATTVAHKTKKKLPQVFKKYGYILAVYDCKQNKTQKYGFWTNKKFQQNRCNNFIVYPFTTNRFYMLL